MVEIDVDRLPARILLDTGVLIRALGHRPDDPNAAACAALFDAIVASNRRLLIAAPSITEIERGRAAEGAAPRPVPADRRVVVVAFDQKAASEAARLLPSDAMKEVAVAQGLKATYLKYDVLIAACAIRWNADVLVTLDTNMRQRYAARTSMPFTAPSEFVAPQPALPLSARPKPTRE